VFDFIVKSVIVLGLLALLFGGSKFRIHISNDSLVVIGGLALAGLITFLLFKFGVYSMPRFMYHDETGAAKLIASSAGRGETVRKEYSTDEQFTGEYWIDGKPIYRLAFNNALLGNLNSLAAGEMKKLPLNVIAPGLSKVVSETLYVWIPNVLDTCRLGNAMASTTTMNDRIDTCLVSANPPQIYFKNKSTSVLGADVSVQISGWIEYTKTTD
jgi:hypothetical protein